MEWLLKILDERAERQRLESARLAEDDRMDEGNLAKVRSNVYGICKAVCQTLGDEKAPEKLAQIHSSWETALSEARVHDDLKKAAVETIKLETLDEVLALMKKKVEE